MTNIIKIVSGCFLLASVSFIAIAQERSAKVCYGEQDRECLEEHVGKAITDPSPDAFDAAYYMGLLLLNEDNDAEGAKKYFEIGAGFGSHKKSQEELEKLIKNKLVEVEPVDCLMSGDVDCLYDFADNKNNAVAQYFLGKEFVKTELVKGSEYYLKAARQGHLTSVCYVVDRYFADELPIDLNHQEAVALRVECYKEPYKRQDKVHFEKYLTLDTHKAYAASDSGRGSRTAGYISGDIAARLALESCQLSNADKESDQPCRVVNIDGEWVKATEPPSLPELVGSDAPFIKHSMNESFKQKYVPITSQKVIAYSLNGVWSWQASSSENVAMLSKLVLGKCQSANKFEAKYPCKIVNINGKWY